MECALLMYCPEVFDFGMKWVNNCDVYVAKLVTLVSEEADSSSSSSLENQNDKVVLQDAKNWYLLYDMGTLITVSVLLHLLSE